MAYTITSESYGRRLPKITATADSTDDLAALGTNYAEGSTVNVGGTTYSLDKVSGWIIPGSGGGGGGGAFIIPLVWDDEAENYTTDVTVEDIAAAYEEGCSFAIETHYERNPAAVSISRGGVNPGDDNILRYYIRATNFRVLADDDEPQGDFNYYEVYANVDEDSVSVSGGAYFFAVTADD